MSNQAIFRLLDLLRTKTDQQHRLSAQQILSLLASEYGIRMNRRTLKGYLEQLIASGYPLNFSSRKRYKQDGTIEIVQTNWYLDPQFEPSEIRLMIDLLHAMPMLPEQIRENLERKLKQISPPTATEQTGENAAKYLHRPPAKQLMFTVDLICEAIRQDCMVQFRYCSFVLKDNQIQLEPRLREDGNERLYIVSPYEIVVSNGRYYLVCCKEPHETISYYRIDRISDIELLPSLMRLPLKDLRADAAEYPRHPAERLYMFSGDAVTCTLRIQPDVLNDVVDWFGEDAAVEANEDNTLLITVNVQPTAMHHWAMQYGGAVEVLSPQSLRQEIAATVHRMAHTYAEDT